MFLLVWDGIEIGLCHFDFEFSLTNPVCRPYPVPNETVVFIEKGRERERRWTEVWTAVKVAKPVKKQGMSAGHDQETDDRGEDQQGNPEHRGQRSVPLIQRSFLPLASQGWIPLFFECDEG